MPNEVNSALLSKILGIRHGFLSNHTPGGREAHDLASPEISTVNQVHGSTLLWTSRQERRERDADALATTTPGQSVGVYSADCTPILMAALGPSSRPLAVMAVHGGWRGTAALIAQKSFAEFAAKGQALGASTFVATIGPCIGAESFEVGEEVVQAFPSSQENGLAKFLREEDGRKKFLFDLPGENARQLREFAAQHKIALTLEVMPHCTFILKEEFPSYRRDGKNAGRLLSYVAFE